MFRTLHREKSSERELRTLYGADTIRRTKGCLHADSMNSRETGLQTSVLILLLVHLIIQYRWQQRYFEMKGGVYRPWERGNLQLLY